MTYESLLSTIHFKTGLSRSDASDALDALVESIAVHLSESERLKFAKQLPERLSDLALSVYATKENSTMAIMQQFAQNQRVKAGIAKKQINAAWSALKQIMSSNEVNDIRSQLSKPNATLLR